MSKTERKSYYVKIKNIEGKISQIFLFPKIYKWLQLHI